MKNKDLISVIIPCFNSGVILKKAVDSIINQTWQELEILVINDGSYEKKTIELFQLLLDIPQLRIINQENSGLPSARNKGVQNAKGKYLFFLDSDDWIEPDSLELMFNILNKNNEIGFVFSDITLEGEVNKVIRKEYNFFEQLFLNQIPYSIFISKKNFIKIGGYDEKMQLGYEDWEFNLRLGFSGIYGKKLSKPIFHYNVSYSGMLLSKSSKYHAKIWKYIISKNKDLYKTRNLISIWFKWRNKPSSYPLLIYLFEYLFFKCLPEKYFSKIFIFLRNFKWIFSRNKKLNIL